MSAMMYVDLTENIDIVSIKKYDIIFVKTSEL